MLTFRQPITQHVIWGRKAIRLSEMVCAFRDAEDSLDFQHREQDLFIVFVEAEVLA
jgi:hypothetical protein